MDSVYNGRRIHAARLAAGYITAVAAASKVGKSRTYFGRMENGHARVTEEVAIAAADAFGVSLQFLANGTPVTPTENVAARIERILIEHPTEFMDEEGVLRLRVLRTELGHASGRAAAKAAGARPSTFMAHEAGARALPVDRMIAYALSLGARPEFAVLGSGSIRPSRADAVNFWVQKEDEPGESSEPGDRRALKWRWLKNGPAGAMTVLPLVESKDGEFRLIRGETLALPRTLWDFSVDAQYYGFVARDATEIKVYIINPSGPKDLVTASPSGTVTLGVDSEGYVPVDILKKRRPEIADQPIALGQLVTTISGYVIPSV